MVFKGCARCGGDLYREEDIGEDNIVCLQCGHRVSVPAKPVYGRAVLAGVGRDENEEAETGENTRS
jgi:DNA-directed RNA polymerase subunit RPC12/RpoP